VMLKKQNLLAIIALFFVAACSTTKTASTVVKTVPSTDKTAPVVKWTTPDWAKNASIYEVNLRQYSKEGTINAFATHLPRLQKMGVKILWLMPIYPICETNKKCNSEKEKTECMGSPYAAYDFEAVNPKLGTLADLKKLVAESHKLGMKIILDFVPDHTGWDSKWMKEHPEYFKKVDGKFTTPIDPASGKATDWTDVAMVDYDNTGLRKAMIDARLFWVKNADVDGFREDVAGFVPSSFWAELRESLNKNVSKPLFMLSEWEDVTDHFTTCFDMNYGWSYHALIKEIYKGVKPATALDEWRAKQKARFVSKHYQMLFTQNHDENSWNGTERESFGDGGNCFTALSFTVEGMGLIYGGQEVSLDKRLSFFHKDEIDWKGASRASFFLKLNELKTKNQALWNGEAGGELVKIKTADDSKVYAFKREKNGDKIVAIFNLSTKKVVMKLDKSLIDRNQLALFAKANVNDLDNITLDGFGYAIYSNK
jgi:alpha-amylase